jgi:cell division initiation protein
MKVTPLEIRQKQFEKKTFGGIDKDEVQAYLNSLSIAWEKMLEDQANLKARLEKSEAEVVQLREVEASLYRTLKTAEDTGQKAIDQALQQAQLIVQEARLKADTLHQEAKWKASRAMEQAEEYAKKSYENMVADVKVLEKELRTIETLKDTFLGEIKIIAQDLLEKADRATQRSANIQFKVPPPPVLDMAKPFLEAKEVEEVIEQLEVPENQQTIGFAVAEPEPVEEIPAPLAEIAPEPEPVAEIKPEPAKAAPARPVMEEPAFRPVAVEPAPKPAAEKSAPVANAGEGSFFDSIG